MLGEVVVRGFGFIGAFVFLRVRLPYITVVVLLCVYILDVAIDVGAVVGEVVALG